MAPWGTNSRYGFTRDLSGFICEITSAVMLDCGNGRKSRDIQGRSIKSKKGRSLRDSFLSQSRGLSNSDSIPDHVTNLAWSRDIYSNSHVKAF